MEFQNRKIKWSCPTWKMSWSTPIPTGGSTSMDGSNSEAGFKSTPAGIPASKTSSSISSEGTKSFISRFLPSLPDTTPSRPNTKKQSGARVLTNKECLDL